ncbi:hypothetical protein K8R03_01680 [Candidatus Kaiserbacteria bacterium]|nr:hypothetical protein [Candidatus Kaiserbacteria bacterium]
MRRVFKRPLYVLLALLTGFAVFLSATSFTALPLALDILSDSSLSLSSSLRLASALLLTSVNDFTGFKAAYVLSVATLVGINVALLTFYFRMYRATPSSGSVLSTGIGSLAAFLGFGCAACGSLFITSFFATLGGTGFLALLPYQGAEIGIAGIFLLLISTFLLARGINRPPVCPI